MSLPVAVVNAVAVAVVSFSHVQLGHQLPPARTLLIDRCSRS